MWRKKILSQLLIITMFGCRESSTARPDPILVGDDEAMPSEIDAATRDDRVILVGRSCFRSPGQQILKAGSPSGGWKVVEDWLEPSGAAQQDLWLAKSENLRMQRGDDAFVWCGRVDDARNMLACLDVHKPRFYSAVISCAT